MPKKKKLTLFTALDDNASTFGKAADRISTRLSGMDKIDPEIETYKKLLPEDLDKLKAEFGFDAVGQYIKSMEVKRLRRK